MGIGNFLERIEKIEQGITSFFKQTTDEIGNAIKNNAKLSIGVGAALAGGVATLGMSNYFNARQNQPQKMAAQCQVATELGDTVQVVGYGAEPLYEARITEIKYGLTAPNGDNAYKAYASHTMQRTDNGYRDVPVYIEIYRTESGGSTDTCTIIDPFSGKKFIADGGIKDVYTNASTPATPTNPPSAGVHSTPTENSMGTLNGLRNRIRSMLDAART